MDNIYLDVKQIDKDVIISLQGHFEAATIVKLKNVVNNLLEEGKRDFVIDLKKVKSINSTAIGLLLTCLKAIKLKKGSLKLRNLESEIMRTFSIMGADKIFTIERDENV
ncbi:MAG: STAS domain-containing protein [Candidatus Hydrogenedentota bacterium]